ncbi:MAG: hypothetical protein PSW75_09790 [bacterium]|nr:hypothetical protein [bacterium]MDI1335876.1 hypothetical protein [Lacunisphaera sp.]
MPTKSKISPDTVSTGADAGHLQACRKAADLSRADLLAVAIARGCAHYAPLWPQLRPLDLAWLPHEVLGCALLRGEADVATFQAIRCGAMVLSDLGNDGKLIAAAAARFGVGARVAQIADLALAADDHPAFWAPLRNALPQPLPGEEDFLPGVSRLVSETRQRGPGEGAARRWLRTKFLR